MSFKYGMNSISRNSDDEDEYSRLVMCLSKQSEFLAMYCSTDLLEIRSVACFLGLLGVWAIGIDGSCIGPLEVCLLQTTSIIFYSLISTQMILVVYTSLLDLVPFSSVTKGVLSNLFKFRAMCSM